MWKKAAWLLIVLLAILVGLYPSLYFITDMSQGVLATKPETLRQNSAWNSAFMLHIIFGGIALLIGWTQFVNRIRTKHLTVHRTIGRTYLAVCVLGGLSALFIAPNATGGMISSLGFGTLAVLWLTVTIRAYIAIRRKQVDIHRAWMTRSYALTFAAVTLRIWLPLSQFVLHFDYIPSYQVISWLCWIPNLLVAELLIRSQRLSKTGSQRPSRVVTLP